MLTELELYFWTDTMETVENYGWSADLPPSLTYLAPPIVRIAKRLGARKVLDLGCGNGNMTAVLARAGFEVTGCDADAQGIEIAQKTYPSVNFRRVGVYDAPDELGSHNFDIVVSTEVVEHLFAPRMLPRFAHSVLRPNGHLLISTPYHGYAKNLTMALLNKWDNHHDPLWDGGHIKFWSPRTLTKLLEDERFKIAGNTGVGRFPYLWKSMICWARKIG